mmetsp:Transcript_4436/g.5668  ORF Transcript_4436/g.5668 Transcript_4436/m.5668 type:complete len:235 (-) Transcript_4436:154-858(-)|eukprot:CAMPEP_0172487760 /NCGR_PEP_ID=MMETSP1066-20121228/16984_1 /TAXON_ID=671091 /ORGANISM="Coscinodiscus wailesii, Strain CCMP2513" /LENGTH=234 /DNA_ID=CAMNT_0013254573 /DNA_START=73 /DNA_END=777 /DNA_ORIENTATION=+
MTTLPLINTNDRNRMSLVQDGSLSNKKSTLSNDISFTGHSSYEDLTLEEFVIALPETIRKQEKKNERDKQHGEELISALFRRLILDKDEWERFSHFDPSRKYTRNLISTDSETYTLLLLCWNPNCSSPIHDHPCNGCWMRVCEGTVAESRFVKDDDTDKLVCSHYGLYSDGAMAYIEDSMGYHKMENPSQNVPAVTLHLYSPPFQNCKIWLNPEKASKPSLSTMCLYSEYGTII